ncbi:MAG: T9SS type A sorting domain-containing protein [Taibaiella sp.]|nr:T9SS type A sorting domain-containing protein [Taibaiella sp.]
MKRNILIAGVLVSFATAPLARAQSIWPSTLNATGGSTTVSGVQLEWSVGEMALVSTFSTSSIVVTQGVLQTRLSGAVNEVTPTSLGDYLTIFPNPANTVVNIQLNAVAEGTLTTRFMDMAGRLITEQKEAVKQGTNAQKIDVSNLAAATYMLQVYYKPNGGKEEATSYKIQKLQ